jgi:hypothetical protein
MTTQAEAFTEAVGHGTLLPGGHFTLDRASACRSR